MGEELYKIEKMRFKGIITHRDLDGAVAAGLISRFFPLPINFSKEVLEANSVIIIETPIGLGGDIRDCLIIDHHMCHDLTQLMGNIILCDESYPSVSRLVLDFFDIDADPNFIELIDRIDNGEIYGNERLKKIFMAYISNIENFPFKKLSSLVREGKWENAFKLFDELYDETRVDYITEKANQLIQQAETLANNVKILVYDPDQYLDLAASRLASLMLQDKGFAVFSIAVKNGFVLYGYFASKTGLNVKKIVKKMKKIGWRAGGRKNVGGFKVYSQVSIDEFKKIVTNLFKNN